MQHYHLVSEYSLACSDIPLAAATLKNLRVVFWRLNGCYFCCNAHTVGDCNSSGSPPVYQAGFFSLVTPSLLFSSLLLSSTVAIRRRRELHSTVLLNSAGEEKYHLYSFYQRMSALLSLFSAYVSTVLIVLSVCQHCSHCSQRMSALFSLLSAYVSTVLIIFSVYQHCSHCFQRISEPVGNSKLGPTLIPSELRGEGKIFQNL